MSRNRNKIKPTFITNPLFVKLERLVIFWVVSTLISFTVRVKPSPKVSLTS